MTTYVALIRGIMPTNPNMKGASLKTAFEMLNLENVTPVIASGNIVFQSDTKDITKLEAELEKVMEKNLGFKRDVIIRSQEDLERLVKKDPFKNIEDKKPNYLVVTFFKDRKKELCATIKLTEGKTPDFMREVEKNYGKQITTRTWKTVGRILKAMEKFDNKI
ncbi:MAG: hypothetical protein JWP09_130 [Candidatus Taylorbacteria bacterium]|nr:hypothetical protein [Candidatus Taylorbacteria bacterium]